MDTLPNNHAGYLRVRGEILASLGPVDEAILRAIQNGNREAWSYLDERRTVLERELITLDSLNQEGRFTK